MQLLFERSHLGRGCTILPACDDINLDASLCRAQAPHLPQLSENEISRHYTELAKQTHGVNDGFYPLGSCTMNITRRSMKKLLLFWALLKFIHFSRNILPRVVWRF